MDVRFRPISTWPGERTEDRKSSRFNSTVGQTMSLLTRELMHLRAEGIIIEADCDESEIRVTDNWLRANARLRSPGVILSFESMHGPLRYPCDTFDKWQDNLRAIAKSLEALRAVDRYGVTRHAEQYKGWHQLPAPEKTMSREGAAVTLVSWSGSEFTSDYVLRFPAVARELYKRAAARTHPDKKDGNEEAFKAVQEAKKVLRIP